MADKALLSDLLLRWEEQKERGQLLTPEQLCLDCPELIEPLRERIQMLEAMAPMFAEDMQPTLASLGNTPRDTASVPKDLPRVPGYEILRELGRGGMGVVYLARQQGLNRLVALKMLLAGAHANELERLRFRREIEAVGQLQHPNVVQVYEVDELEGRPFFSMEYVEGGDLRNYLQGRLLPAEDASVLVETLARTMHLIHAQGIVHRDLKPANVLLGARSDMRSSLDLVSKKRVMPGSLPIATLPTPKITDFGLAKPVNDDDGPTLSGQVVGTPSYMSPEQAAGKIHAIGPTADIYALGAILYELLTGRPPFHGETALATVLQVVHDDPVPPRQLLSTVPLDLETICLKCLHKDPARRYASAEELADDLRRFRVGEPILARPVGTGERMTKWARRHPARATLIAASVIALIVGAISAGIYQVQLSDALTATKEKAAESRRRLVRLQVLEGMHLLDEADGFGALLWFAEALTVDQDPQREAMHRMRFAAALDWCPQLDQLWMHDGPLRHAEFSPGGLLALTLSDNGVARVWDVATGVAVGPALRHDSSAAHAAFHPNGRLVATGGADGFVVVWDAITGERLIASSKHPGAVRSVRFRPDGEAFVSASSDGTAGVWETKTGRLLRTLKHEKAVVLADFSPDGQWIVTASEDGAARLWKADANDPAAVLKHDGPLTWAAFDSTSTRVATASADGTARVWSVSTGKPLSEPLHHRGAVVHVAFSPGGGRLVTSSRDHNARVWDSDTGKLGVTLAMSSGVNWASFSADGRWIVTGGDDNSALVWDADTGAWLTPLLKHTASIKVCIFDATGSRVLTAGNDHAARLWSVKPRETHFEPGNEKFATAAISVNASQWLSADGQWVVKAEKSLGARLYKAGTELPFPLLPHGQVVAAAFCPDCDVLVTGSDDNTAKLWNPKTGILLAQPLRHRGTVSWVALSKDGKLVLTGSADQTARVWDASTGEPITPALRLPPDPQRLAFSEDGKSVLVEDAKGTVRSWKLRAEERSADELRSLAQMLAGCRIDPERGLLPLSDQALEQLWQGRK